MAPEASRPPRVAMFTELSGVYGRGILYGVARYIREHRPWELILILGTAEDPSRLVGWQGEGLIARLRTGAAMHTIQSLSCHKFFFGWDPQTPGFPMANAAGMSHSHRYSAQVALDYFLARGYRRVGFVRYADQARQGHGLDGPFAELAVAASTECDVYHPTDPAVVDGDPEAAQRDLVRWVAQLQRPIGLWAANDVRGLDVLDACRVNGLRVPEDVAVLGHHNDDLICEMCSPPLSSITIPYEQMGYDAAALLDRMMVGEKPPTRMIEYQATGVVSRRSTDIVAVEDGDLADALRFIRDNAARGIGIDDVVTALQLSRSTLHRRFKKVFGRTPSDEIDRVRIERAKELLAYTEIPMSQIAARCGYSGAPRLAEAFGRLMKQSPTSFRKLHRTSFERPYSSEHPHACDALPTSVAL